MNCTLGRHCLRAGRIAVERIFQHFFPKAALPDKFELLAKSFTDKGDTVLAHHQASLKIGVEGTIALVIASGEKLTGPRLQLFEV
jgi:ketosteroid isomerase-like protein